MKFAKQTGLSTLAMTNQTINGARSELRDPF